jgi:hypothetical protein
MKMFREKNSKPKLSGSGVIDDIEKHIFELYHSPVKLCFPRLAKQQKELHFIILCDRVLDLEEFAALVKYIRDRVDFGNIFVQSKKYWKSDEKFEATYSEKVDYSANNKEKIELFINTCYPSFFKLQQLYKEHGVPTSCFEEDEFDQMLRTDIAASIREICDATLEGQMVVNEDVVVQMFANILEKAGQCGLDTEKIVSEFKQRASSLVLK